MLTIISFILTLLGSINWLMIGLLQYDFVAGIFGYQASVFSRIIYIIIGLSSAILVYKLIKGKGTLAILSRRNKKDVAKKIEQMQNKSNETYAENQNIEASSDYTEFRQKEQPTHSDGQSLFDEHFDRR
jgi:hypothetical protein